MSARTGPKNLEKPAEKIELSLLVGIGDDGPYPAVVTLLHGPLWPAQEWPDGIVRWNGWVAEPRFDRATVDLIVTMLERDTRENPDSDVPSWDGDTLVLHSPVYARIIRWDASEQKIQDDPDPDYRPERITPDADGRYAVGAYAWCWYEWDERIGTE